MLKLLRRIDPGIHPEAEMTRYLTEAGLSATPRRCWARWCASREDGTPHTLMLAQAFVRNQGDGWGWTLDWLQRAVDEAALTDEAEPRMPFAGYLAFAAALGRRLGELHAVLARPTDNADFAPEPAQRGGSCRLGRRRAGAARPRRSTCWRTGAGLAEDARRWRRRVWRSARRCMRRSHRLAAAADGALKTRVHGDFHLGQVLVAQGDAVIVDFEGEPAAPAGGTPRQGQPAARRGRAAAQPRLRGRGRHAPPSLRRGDRGAGRAPRGPVRALAARGGGSFPRCLSCVETSAEHPWVPAGSEAALLDLFLLEKAAYEIRYEAANRPAWIGVPLRGLATLADRIAQ